MYLCDICGKPSLPNQPLQKITLYREKEVIDRDHHPPKVKVIRSIKQEIPSCGVCLDGFKAGIPLDKLRSMHRPASLPATGAVSALRQSNRPEEATASAPPACASTPSPSPKEEAPALPSNSRDLPVLPVRSVLEKNGKMARHARTEQLLNQQEERGKRNKPAKPLKRLRNANRGEAAKAAKQQGRQANTQ